MATILPTLSLSPRRDVLRDAWRRNPPLVALVLAMMVLATVALVGLVVDPTQTLQSQKRPAAE